MMKKMRRTTASPTSRGLLSTEPGYFICKVRANRIQDGEPLKCSNMHTEYWLALELKTIHKCFLCPYKMQISMLRLIALREVREHKNVPHLQQR